MQNLGGSALTIANARLPLEGLTAPPLWLATQPLACFFWQVLQGLRALRALQAVALMAARTVQQAAVLHLVGLTVRLPVLTVRLPVLTVRLPAVHMVLTVDQFP